ncbi:hypothetical protein Tco_0536209 [Tanacetum coccineum]
MSSSTVTYTSVYTNFEPWRFYGGFDEEPADAGSPRVIVYGYDGLPMHPVAPPSQNYGLTRALHHLPKYVPVLSTHLFQITYLARVPEIREERPDDDHADYPADGGDGDDEPSDDDDDDDDADDEDEEL